VIGIEPSSDMRDEALHWMEPQGTFAEALGREPAPWHWSARVRIGVV
jgi:hypothetical protein